MSASVPYERVETSASEFALVRIAKARARALESITAAREMVRTLKLLRQQVPEPARDAVHEIRKAVNSLHEEVERQACETDGRRPFDSQGTSRP